EEPWRPNKNPDAPKARDVMKMSALPKECRAVLAAPSPESEMAATFRGRSSGYTAWDAGPSIASVIEEAGEIVPRPDVAVGASAFLPPEGIAVPLPQWRPQK